MNEQPGYRSLARAVVALVLVGCGAASAAAPQATTSPLVERERVCRGEITRWPTTRSVDSAGMVDSDVIAACNALATRRAAPDARLRRVDESLRYACARAQCATWQVLEARRERDIVRLTCQDNRRTDLLVTLRTGFDQRQELASAIEADNAADVAQLTVSLDGVAQRAAALAVGADLCEGHHASTRSASLEEPSDRTTRAGLSAGPP
jgi:hypothetical protein